MSKAGDLPAWVLQILDANLHVLEQRGGTDMRRMTELLMDTGRRRWDPGLLARACSRDRIQHGGVDQAVGGREPEKRPQRTQFCSTALN